MNKSRCELRRNSAHAAPFTGIHPLDLRHTPACLITRIPVWASSIAWILILLGSISGAFGQVFIGDVPHPSPMQVSPSQTGLTAENDTEKLAVALCGDSIVHVVSTPLSGTSTAAAKPWMMDTAVSCPSPHFEVQRSGDTTTLATSRVRVLLSAMHGNITIQNGQGEQILREVPSLPRTYYDGPAGTNGLYQVTDRFALDPREAIYGLGQHQSGVFNYRGSTVELGQQNTDVAIPLLISSNGYAILWNTASFTYVDNRFPQRLNLESMASNAVDYYVLYGPEMDQIIHEYRSLTGHVPMLPKWALGFFQSKDRYSSQDEVLRIAHEYRSRHIPLDAIVQDWFWWKKGGKGDPVFNSNYLDVPKELEALHAEHIHAMISVWGQMDTTSNNYQEMKSQGLEIAGTHVYDATNPAARDFFWNRLVGKLFAEGWDAFWLDSAEPEEYWPHMGDAILRYRQLHIGPGSEYTNIFPLEHNEGVEQHWKATNPDKRVFLLTRSAFLGQQRTGAAVWSGDVFSSWWSLRHQVAAGLNFALSGFPYWTTDIGGYWQPVPRPPNDPAYQELYARWFEYGVFCPIFRTHGHRTENELWSYDRVFPTLLSMDQLRYRLMPYLYSLAWQVASRDYTIQRPLVMDFRDDHTTWDLGDEFLFGPDLLVSPVLREHAASRSVYLPDSTNWYDFWTGDKIPGGQGLTVAAPLDRIPLHVRAGSILPLGPPIEYAGQAVDPIELRIYPGADGDFSLYEDQGDGYGYEKGDYALTQIHWDDATQTLTIGDRKGHFPGMAGEHTFNLVVVRKGHGVGPRGTTRPDEILHYTGSKIEKHL